MHTPLFSKVGKHAHAPHVNMGCLREEQPRVFDLSRCLRLLLRLVDRIMRATPANVLYSYYVLAHAGLTTGLRLLETK
jgi:hypothetical protein